MSFYQYYSVIYLEMDLLSIAEDKWRYTNTDCIMLSVEENGIFLMVLILSRKRIKIKSKKQSYRNRLNYLFLIIF